MSNVVELIPAAVDRGLIPVYVSGNVPALVFLNALASAGLTYRHDIRNKVLIIEQAKEDAHT